MPVAEPVADVVWIDDDASARDLVAQMQGLPEAAIDTEFHRERTYYPKLALVQVAWPGGLALVDPLAVSHDVVGAIVTAPDVVVAHAADQDLEVLDRSCGVAPRSLFDTQLAAGFLGFSSPSLGSLAGAILDVQLSKGDRLTDWLRRPLTADQRSYAASDVAHLLEMAAIIRERLAAVGRLEWAEQECAQMLAGARRPQEPETAWWRIKEGRQLRGRARAVAQEVAAWRERRAAQLDRPTRTVLPDLAIVGIANKPPRTPQQLDQIRGLEGRRPSGGAVQELLDAVERGLKLPLEAVHLPVVEDTPRHLRPAIGLVSAWVSQLSRELEIDTTLLATRSDLEALLRNDPNARLANGWRAGLVGEPVRKLVSGEAALAFSGDGSLLLEERSHRPVIR